jgi:hypothetical protein
MLVAELALEPHWDWAIFKGAGNMVEYRTGGQEGFVGTDKRFQSNAITM